MIKARSLPGWAPPVAAMLVVLLINTVLFPSFFQLRLVDGRLTGSLVDVLIRGAPVALLALGMAGVIATRGIDLSVGAVMAIAGAVAANALAGGASWTSAIVYALAAGLACGLWNGMLVGFLKLQPIVATLVLMVAGRGIAQLITGGQITTFDDAPFAALAGGTLLTIPAPILIVATIAVLLTLLVRSTALGLMVEAIGVNPRAAELVGINTRSIVVAVYALSGVTAALAGIIATADIKGADANNAGLWLEPDAILVVVLGGGSLLGGRLSYGLTIVGAITLQAIKTGILLAGFPPQMGLILMAVMVSILLVVQAPALQQWLQHRALRRAAS
ncbi:ABC transporter permease [Sphingomonas daechungensis]|uniref:ABC transporter permease n=1 Tax=Sphingomonas daechungensis TaxID=1176646 RepID=A0ABX6T3L7_9SPHN|nr:ABC transporter permease [Sphingomonas daechungensis]QNP43497.1 ABC transporter permease [Sphingomonas daechungensis]